MKTVYLYGSLGKRFGKKHCFYAKNVPEVFGALESNCEGFFEYILNRKKEGIEYAIFKKNPYSIRNEKEAIDSVFFQEEFNLEKIEGDLYVVPISEGGGFITAIVTAFKAISWASVAIMTVASVAISFAINALFKPPEPPKPGKSITTKSFLLSASQNRQAQGIPVPVGYGRLKIGAANVDVKQESKKLPNANKTSLALESYTDVEYIDILSEGPIEGFVGQAGRDIVGEDIREGVFLNNVPIKTRVEYILDGEFGKKQEVVDSFNYILNEGGELPEFKKGSDSETKLLSNQVSALTEYNTLLYGPRPYFASDRALMEHDNISEANKYGAKTFSHACRNPNVDKFIVTLSAELSQADQSGNTYANSCRFAINMSRGGRNINVLDFEADEAIAYVKCDEFENSLNEAYKAIRDARAKESALAADWETEKSTFESIERLIKDVRIDFKESQGSHSANLSRDQKHFSDVGIVEYWYSSPKFYSNGKQKSPKITADELEIYKKWKNSKYISVKYTYGSTSTRSRWGTTTSEYVKEVIATFNYTPIPETVDKSKKPGVFTDIENGYFVVYGIASAPYAFDVEIGFNPDLVFDPNQGASVISVVRLSSEYDSTKYDSVTYDGQSKLTVYEYLQFFDQSVPTSSKTSNSHYTSAGGSQKNRRLTLLSIQDRIGASLLYPHTAMCKIKFDSKNFKTIPNRSYHVKLKKVCVPQNYNPKSRTYDGPWNGLFRGQNNDKASLNSIPDSEKMWTDNPAWIFFDLLQNPRFGLGKYGLEEYNIDKWQLYSAAKYCDELVETRHLIETSTLFPRTFSTDNIIRYDEGDPQDGSFDIKIGGRSYEVVNDTGQVEYYDDYETLDENQFIKEFGAGTSLQGKKVAFFIYQHNKTGPFSDAIQESFAEKSVIRRGNYTIEERVLKESDPKAKTITVFGPNFKNNSATFPEDGIYKTIGGCCLQKNHPIAEPRFTCNLYLTEKTSALRAMNDIASVFRGLVGYNFGKILTMQDRKKNPMMLFNNSNIDRNHGFNYFGTEKNKRFTSVLVRFNNQNKSYAPDAVFEEDADAVRLFGHQPREIMGFGVTSETQARRLAKWALMTSQVEIEKISFIASDEASYLFPGCVFEVSDENRAGKNMSGRVLDVASFENGLEYILIDKSAQGIIAIDNVEITVSAGLPTVSDEDFNDRASSFKSEIDQDEQINTLTSPAPQFIKFQGVLSYNPDTVKKQGPQGQSSVVTNLMAKLAIDLDIQRSIIKVFNHQLQNGDRVRFTSAGVLPSGLSKGQILNQAYYIVNRTEHSFQVSKTENGAPVYFYDNGKDQFGNEGGIHYVCIENNSNASSSQLNQDYINQIEVGASYSMQGIYGTETSGQNVVPENKNNYLIIGNYQEDDSWYNTSIFGPMFIDKSGEWGFCADGIFNWVNISYMRSDRSNTDFFSFHITNVGWFRTTNDLSSSYWYFIDTEGTSQNQWLAPYYYTTPDLQLILAALFLYEDNHTKNVGDIVVLGKAQFEIVGTKSFGYFVMSQADKDSSKFGADIILDNETISTLDSNLGTLSVGQPPGYQNHSINNIELVSAENSIQDKASIRITLPDGHGLDLYENTKITITNVLASPDPSGFAASINSNWDTIFISKNQVELVDSEDPAGKINSATINSKGFLEYIESLKSLSLRSFQSQLFRTISVKEVNDRKYEVTALEYNDSKFDAIDKHMSVKIPSVPIPPQADMDIPEPPENLFLTDLTK